MIRISDLISERQQYAIGTRITPWRDELLAQVIENPKQGSTAFITVGSTLYEKRKINALQRQYYITGVYKIGAIFTNTSTPFYIVQLSDIPSTELKIALFNESCYEAKSVIVNEGSLCIPESYTKEWNQYIGLLEGWINDGTTPKSNKEYEFKTIALSDLFQGSFMPETYSAENIELRQLLDKQDTKALSELAEIVTPRSLSEKNIEAKVLTIRDLKYPLDISEIRMGAPTNVVLQRGDIIIPKIRTKINAYLFNYDGKEVIYASNQFTIIKCKEILPEYVYLYLTNDIALKALNARYVGVAIQRISAQEIASLPIALPTQDKQKYISDFQTLTNYGFRSYDQLQLVSDYYERLVRIEQDKEKPETVEDILNIELAENIRAYREDQLRSFLSDDLKELNTCFREKAYKATLILAGSILEAVLIDWLSEIHHKNYFDEDYYVTDWNGRQKRADLIDYINEIKYIRRPSWANEASKAHTIRTKRNLVHAKLCLKSDDINEEVCRLVISYLSDVLKTRGVNTGK